MSPAIVGNPGVPFIRYLPINNGACCGSGTARVTAYLTSKLGGPITDGTDLAQFEALTHDVTSQHTIQLTVLSAFRRISRVGDRGQYSSTATKAVRELSRLR